MATRYWRGTTSVYWNNTANWSATSGGATGASVPGSSDDVIFDGGGNTGCQLDMNVVVSSVDMQKGYTNTLTFKTYELDCSGGTLGFFNMDINGTGTYTTSAKAKLALGMGGTQHNCLTCNSLNVADPGGNLGAGIIGIERIYALWSKVGNTVTIGIANNTLQPGDWLRIESSADATNLPPSLNYQVLTANSSSVTVFAPTSNTVSSNCFLLPPSNIVIKGKNSGDGLYIPSRSLVFQYSNTLGIRFIDTGIGLEVGYQNGYGTSNNIMSLIIDEGAKVKLLTQCVPTSTGFASETTITINGQLNLNSNLFSIAVTNMIDLTFGANSDVTGSGVFNWWSDAGGVLNYVNSKSSAFSFTGLLYNNMYYQDGKILTGDWRNTSVVVHKNQLARSNIMFADQSDLRCLDFTLLSYEAKADAEKSSAFYWHLTNNKVYVYRHCQICSHADLPIFPGSGELHFVGSDATGIIDIHPNNRLNKIFFENTGLRRVLNSLTASEIKLDGGAGTAQVYMANGSMLNSLKKMSADRCDLFGQNLALEYNFTASTYSDGDTIQNVVDSSIGSTVCKGGATKTTGPNGSEGALAFNGTTQYLESTFLTKRLQSFCLSFSIKANASANLPVYFESNPNITSYNGVFDVRQDATGSGKIRFVSLDSTAGVAYDISSSSTVFDNAWHHVCFIEQDRNIYLYVDGVLNTLTTNTVGSVNRWGSKYMTGLYNNAATPILTTTWIGRRRASTSTFSYMSGSISRFRIIYGNFPATQELATYLYSNISPLNFSTATGYSNITAKNDYVYNCANARFKNVWMERGFNLAAKDVGSNQGNNRGIVWNEAVLKAAATSPYYMIQRNLPDATMTRNWNQTSSGYDLSTGSNWTEGTQPYGNEWIANVLTDPALATTTISLGSGATLGELYMNSTASKYFQFSNPSASALTFSMANPWRSCKWFTTGDTSVATGPTHNLTLNLLNDLEYNTTHMSTLQGTLTGSKKFIYNSPTPNNILFWTSDISAYTGSLNVANGLIYFKNMDVSTSGTDIIGDPWLGNIHSGSTTVSSVDTSETFTGIGLWDDVGTTRTYSRNLIITESSGLVNVLENAPTGWASPTVMNFKGIFGKTVLGQDNITCNFTGDVLLTTYNNNPTCLYSVKAIRLSTSPANLFIMNVSGNVTEANTVGTVWFNSTIQDGVYGWTRINTSYNCQHTGRTYIGNRTSGWSGEVMCKVVVGAQYGIGNSGTDLTMMADGYLDLNGYSLTLRSIKHTDPQKTRMTAATDCSIFNNSTTDLTLTLNQNDGTDINNIPIYFGYIRSGCYLARWARSGGTATCYCTDHGFTTGDTIWVMTSSSSTTIYTSAQYTVTVTNSRVFTMTVANTGSTAGYIQFMRWSGQHKKMNLIKDGTSHQGLYGNNIDWRYRDPILVNAGVLFFNSDSSLGRVPATPQTDIIVTATNAGIGFYDSAYNTVLSANREIDITNSSTALIWLYTSGASFKQYYLDGIIKNSAGSASVRILGTGPTDGMNIGLRAANTYSGDTIVDNTVLSIASRSNLGDLTSTKKLILGATDHSTYARIRFANTTATINNLQEIDIYIAQANQNFMDVYGRCDLTITPTIRLRGQNDTGFYNTILSTTYPIYAFPKIRFTGDIYGSDIEQANIVFAPFKGTMREFRPDIMKQSLEGTIYNGTYTNSTVSLAFEQSCYAYAGEYWKNQMYVSGNNQHTGGASGRYLYGTTGPCTASGGIVVLEHANAAGKYEVLKSGTIASDTGAIGTVQFNDGGVDYRGKMMRITNNDVGGYKQVRTLKMDGQRTLISGSIYRYDFNTNMSSRVRLNSTTTYELFTGGLQLDRSTTSRPIGLNCGYFTNAAITVQNPMFISTGSTSGRGYNVSVLGTIHAGNSTFSGDVYLASQATNTLNMTNVLVNLHLYNSNARDFSKVLTYSGNIYSLSYVTAGLAAAQSTNFTGRCIIEKTGPGIVSMSGSNSDIDPDKFIVRNGAVDIPTDVRSYADASSQTANVTKSSNVLTFTKLNHGYAAGDIILVNNSNSTNGLANGYYQIVTTATNTFTVTATNSTSLNPNPATCQYEVIVPGVFGVSISDRKPVYLGPTRSQLTNSGGRIFLMDPMESLGSYSSPTWTGMPTKIGNIVGYSLTATAGMTLTAGDWVVITSAIVPYQNGIFVVQATTSTWTRWTELDENAESCTLAGKYVKALCCATYHDSSNNNYQTYTTSSSVATVVHYNHGLKVGSQIYIHRSSGAASLPIGDYTVATVIDDNTFTIPTAGIDLASPGNIDYMRYQYFYFPANVVLSAIAFTANATLGSNKLTAVSSMTNLNVGMYISGTGLPSGARTMIIGIDSANSTIYLNQIATSTATTSTMNILLDSNAHSALGVVHEFDLNLTSEIILRSGATISRKITTGSVSGDIQYVTDYPRLTSKLADGQSSGTSTFNNAITLNSTLTLNSSDDSVLAISGVITGNYAVKTIGTTVTLSSTGNTAASFECSATTTNISGTLTLTGNLIVPLGATLNLSGTVNCDTADILGTINNTGTLNTLH